MSSLVGSKVSPLRKGNAIATLFAATGFGTLVAGFIGSLLLEKCGWHSVFYLFGILSFLWSVGMFFFSRHYRRKEAENAALYGQEMQDLEPLVPNGESPNSKGEKERGKPFSCRTLITKCPFWALILSHQCVDFAFFITLSWLPTYFTETFPEGKGWVFNVLPWVVATFMSVASGWLGDWMIEKGFSVIFTRKLLVAITFIGLAIPLFLVSTTHSYHTALGCLVAAVGFQAMCNGGLMVNPQDITPDHAGMVFGISNGLAGIQGFLSTYIVGIILHLTGQWSIVFQLAGSIAIAGLIIFSLFGAGHPVM